MFSFPYNILQVSIPAGRRNVGGHWRLRKQDVVKEPFLATGWGRCHGTRWPPVQGPSRIDAQSPQLRLVALAFTTNSPSDNAVKMPSDVDVRISARHPQAEGRRLAPVHGASKC